MESCSNKRPCPCTYDCPRHGKCCACVAHHRDHEGGIPGCFFSKEGEATYDRSLEALWKDRGGGSAGGVPEGTSCTPVTKKG